MHCKSFICGALALPLALAASQAMAGPCSQDIAQLDKQMSQLGVDPAAKAADRTGSTSRSGSGSNGGITPPGVSAAKGVTTMPEKSAAGQAANASSGDQKVDPRAITALQEARKADIQGDAQKCKDAVDAVRKHLKS